jgi:hypothetical protein
MKFRKKKHICPLASDISCYIYHYLSVYLSLTGARFPFISPCFPARLEHGLKAVMARKLAKLDAQLQRASDGGNIHIGWWKYRRGLQEGFEPKDHKIWDIIKYIAYYIYICIYIYKEGCVCLCDGIGIYHDAIFGVFSWTIWGNMSEYWVYGIKLPYKTNNSGGYDTGYVTNENGITMGRWMGIYNVFMVFNLTYGILIL